MSLNKKAELYQIAKIYCRELRNNQTHSEKLLWSYLQNKKILGKKFLRQFPIFHDITGIETFYIADFYCHSSRLIIEIDGKIHRFRINADNDRSKILNFMGYKIIRFSNEEVETEIYNVVKKITNYLLIQQ